MEIDFQKAHEYSNFRMQNDSFYSKYYKCIEKAEKTYKLFINNKYKFKYFKKLAKLYDENLKNSEYFRYLENIGNKMINSSFTTSYNAVFVIMAKSCERLGMYKEAIEICQQAIRLNYTDDNTKDGMSGRIKRLEKKL